MVWHVVKRKKRACSNLNSGRNKPILFTAKTQAFTSFCGKTKEKRESYDSRFSGLSDWTWTSGLYHPKVARYQLRHTQMSWRLVYYSTLVSDSQVLFIIFCNFMQWINIVWILGRLLHNSIHIIGRGRECWLMKSQRFQFRQRRSYYGKQDCKLLYCLHRYPVPQSREDGELLRPGQDPGGHPRVQSHCKPVHGLWIHRGGQILRSLQ